MARIEIINFNNTTFKFGVKLDEDQIFHRKISRMNTKFNLRFEYKHELGVVKAVRLCQLPVSFPFSCLILCTKLSRYGGIEKNLSKRDLNRVLKVCNRNKFSLWSERANEKKW